MNNLLIKTNYNWADEADFPSFCIMTQTEFEEAKDFVKDFFNDPDYSGVSVCVGSNEEIEFDSYKDVFGGVTALPITEEEAETITRLFGVSFGECTLEDVIENIGYVIED